MSNDIHPPEISFTPLRGNRFRCNWSRRERGKTVIIGRGALPAYRTNLFHRLHPRTKMVEKPHEFRVALSYYRDMVRCPRCGAEHHFGGDAGRFSCDECRSVLVVRRNPPPWLT